MPGKYTSFFRENYHCKTLTHSSERKEGDKMVVQGRCACDNSSKMCSWKHIIDAKGNVIKTEETGCPCSNLGIKVKEHKTGHGIKTGKAIAIGFSVLGGIVLIIGIIYLIKHHKVKKDNLNKHVGV